MAEKATADRVAADMSPPAYRQAVQRIRSIPAKKEKIAGLNGDIADIWAKVEGHKVDKIAGKFFARIDKMDHAERMRVMRDFNGLCDAAGWEEESSDLVDNAENKVVQMRAGIPGAKQTDGEASGEDGTEEASVGAKAALERARKRLGADKDKGSEPYTGDNSDLAGDDDK